MALAREETFGPVLSIIPVDDVDDAVRVANDCDYGLAGSVFGRDRRVVDDVVERFATGAISINDALATALLPGLPFGGVRSSGFGRLHGDAGIREDRKEHTSELQSLMRISYAVFCLKKKHKHRHYRHHTSISSTRNTSKYLHTK